MQAPRKLLNDSINCSSCSRVSFVRHQQVSRSEINFLAPGKCFGQISQMHHSLRAQHIHLGMACRLGPSISTREWLGTCRHLTAKPRESSCRVGNPECSPASEIDVAQAGRTPISSAMLQPKQGCMPRNSEALGRQVELLLVPTRGKTLSSRPQRTRQQQQECEQTPSYPQILASLPRVCETAQRKVVVQEHGLRLACTAHLLTP